MTRTFPALLLALLLSTAVIACGGGDDDATATSPTGDATPASTNPSDAAVASPTLASSGESTATGSPETGGFTDEEAALIDLLLAAGDLPGSWNQLRVEAPELSDAPGICDVPRFPQADERVAEVEVEYQSADGSQFVLQDITEFPEEVAVEAMAYIRETATCSEWTDASGAVFEISQTAAPDLGDESHAIQIAFQVADAGRLEGDFIFVRVGGFVTIVTTLALDDYDPALSSQIASLATGKIDALAGTGSSVTDDESAAIAGLLSLDDLADEWDQPRPAHRSDPEGWTGLCDAELFPDHDAAIARVGVEFYEGFEAESATLTQLLIVYPADLAEEAFAYEQEAASCDSFTGGAFDVTLEPADDFPAFGDESFAVRFAFDNNDEPVEGYWMVIRAGDALTTLIYTDPNALSNDEAEELAELATSRMTDAVR